MYDTRVLGKRYFRQIGKSEDYLLWLEILKEIDYANSLQENLAFYRLRSDSRSSNKIKVMYYQWKIYRKYEHLNLLKTLYFFINYIYFGLKRISS